jgi:predicted Ser/Thr protein kinase
MKFSEFLDNFVENPLDCLHTSSTLIAEAIKHFGFQIVVRSGEPTVSYNIFEDPFSNGTNAVFGQEFCIKQIVDVIESVGKESSPNRGIVLVGPPASGKTNIVDLISLALEEYTKQHDARLYSFYFRFESREGRVAELRPPFMRNPILLFPTSLQHDHEITHPRRELFELINSDRGKHEKIVFPTYYQNAFLDKRCLDVLEGLMENPRNADKSLFEVLEECVRVEEVEFSNAQAKGIANIDDMRQLRVKVHQVEMGQEDRAVVNEHLPGAHLYEYQGALVAANRGLLHIHDAFGGPEGRGPSEDDYKPLLMLLGSGKASIEATQAALDTTVILTTNIEEMGLLERQLTSSKLLDRIDEIPVNYLLDANSEMEIMRRDLANMREKYDVDPNLLRVAAYFSVLTRLLPPRKTMFPGDWSEEKKNLYRSITPEQKLFIYATQPDDPVGTIRKLPHWHPFRSEMIKLGVNIHDTESFSKLVARHSDRVSLEQSAVFSNEQLKLVDDEFMRELWNEYYPDEGKHGISVRQLQNIMRDTINHSDGFRIHVGTFFSQLKRIFAGSPSLHHWLPLDAKHKENREQVPVRTIGRTEFAAGEGDYGDFKGLSQVAQAIYNDLVRREITVATVNRDPEEIALDLRKYLQHSLLAKAHENRAFAHIMIPRFTYIDPVSGEKVDRPDVNYLASIEQILAPSRDPTELRRETAQRFLDLHASGELVIEEGKSVVASRSDNVLTCFGQEYNRLLSHRRTMGAIDAEQLVEAFFQKRRSTEKYEAFSSEVRDFVENIILNLQRRFSYSKQSALDTVIFALRKNIIDFAEMIS